MALTHPHPSVPEFGFNVPACKCWSVYSQTRAISMTSCTPKSLQQSCHMQVGGSLSITQIAEWEAYHQVQPNHLICLCSIASLIATEHFMASSSLTLVSEGGRTWSQDSWDLFYFCIYFFIFPCSVSVTCQHPLSLSDPGLKCRTVGFPKSSLSNINPHWSTPLGRPSNWKIRALIKCV